MNKLYQENVKQYEISKNTMAYLHDVKNRIFTIADSKAAFTAEEKDKIMKDIDVLDSQVNSGNETLDIILAEKRMLCLKHNIEFSYMVDGKSLDFIDVYDICNLFGNAITNAIEASERQEENHAKYILLVIRSEMNMVMIHLENAYHGRVEMKNGYPVSQNTDHDAHGFGVQSMRKIVEKYGGEIHFAYNDDIFSLNILFSRQ